MSPSSPAGSSSSSLPYSNVLLALPDGPIGPGPDRSSSTISFIGGYPTFPYTVDPPNCGACHLPIPLLAQVYCPPEDGENDRTIYVFGCNRGKCQRRDGSIRAFRASKRNEEYVRDVEAKRKVREEEERKERERRKVNPFTMTDQPNGALFGGGDLFGAPAPSIPFGTTETNDAPDISTLSIASTSTTLSPPHPAYQPSQYLSTIEEYLPPPGDVEMDDDDDEEDEAERAAWRDERFESLLPRGMDVVFERFVRRLESAEGGRKQVLRYELGGIPLPYSSTSPLTKKLFPTLPPTKPDDEEPVYSEHYQTMSIPPCPRCKGPRVFELQLVPSLIALLTPDTLSNTGEETSQSNGVWSEEERKKQLAKMAAGEGEGGEEMEWGTVVVFGCERDCVGSGEEWVGVEWETTLSNAK